MRQATQADLDLVVRLGLDFHAASPHSVDPVDLEGWTVFASQLIEHGGVFVSDGGMIGDDGAFEPVGGYAGPLPDGTLSQVAPE